MLLSTNRARSLQAVQAQAIATPMVTSGLITSILYSTIPVLTSPKNRSHLLAPSARSLLIWQPHTSISRYRCRLSLRIPAREQRQLYDVAGARSIGIAPHTVLHIAPAWNRALIGAEKEGDDGVRKPGRTRAERFDGEVRQTKATTGC